MNRRHAAALGLVGWYLMVPPLSHNSKKVVYNLPISRWSILAAYDSAMECQQGKHNALDGEGLAEVHPMSSEVRSVVAEAIRGGQCIATDDPRLKGGKRMAEYVPGLIVARALGCFACGLAEGYLRR